MQRLSRSAGQTVPHPPCPSSVEPLGARRTACPPLCWFEIIRLFKIQTGDIRFADKFLDLNPSRFLGNKVPELLVGKNNKLVLLDFVTFYDLVRRNLFACGISDPLKADPGEILLVEQMRSYRLGFGGGIEPYGDVDQSKCDRPFPDCFHS
jgi:hypothetical protein